MNCTKCPSCYTFLGPDTHGPHWLEYKCCSKFKTQHHCCSNIERYDTHLICKHLTNASTTIVLLQGKSNTSVRQPFMHSYLNPDINTTVTFISIHTGESQQILLPKNCISMHLNYKGSYFLKLT